MIENIEFEAEVFNELYHELDEAFLNELIRFIFIYGGSSSSKSYTIAQRLIIYAMEGKGNNSYVFKLISSKIDETIYATFETIVRSWDLEEYFVFQKHHIKCKLTGSFIDFSGLDDADKVKGLEGYRKIFIDELDQVSHAAYKQLRKRLRGQKNQQIISAFNPVSEMSYIKTEIFDKEDFKELPTKSGDLKQINSKGNTLLIRTNYKYNIWIVGDGKGGGFIDQHTIDDFEADRINDINYYNIYALGHWGKLRTGGEFLKQFKSEKHVGNYSYNPNEPLHIAFDENVLPYLTLNVFQVQNGNVRQIDEIHLKDPLNTLKDTCEEFCKRYKEHATGLFVYGDATSKKADSKLQKGQNFYLLIKGYLAKFKPIFRIPKSNPSVIMSRNFVNDILAGEIEDVTFGVDAKCRNSINDYQYCTEDEEGKVNKKVIRNKETGLSWQEFGHCCDVLRYLLTAIYIEKYKKFMRG